MEIPIPIANGIIDFEGNVNTLHNPYPSTLNLSQSQVSASGIEKVFHFWKWGALMLAFVASFTTILKVLNSFVIRLHCKRLSQQIHLHQTQHLLDDDSSNDTDTDTSCSSLSDDDDDEEDKKEENKLATDAEDFRVKGSPHVYIDQQWQNRNIMGRRRSIADLFSWSDLTSGKRVVKLWDNLNLGLGLGFNVDDSATIYNVNTQREIQKISSFIRCKCEIPALFASSSSSPAVIFSAAENNTGAVALSGWDRRIGYQIPSILAEWRPKLGNTVGVRAGGVEKLYVRDNVNSALTLADMRKVNSALGDLTENEVDTWWDADAVIATEERGYSLQDSN